MKKYSFENVVMIAKSIYYISKQKFFYEIYSGQMTLKSIWAMAMKEAWRREKTIKTIGVINESKEVEISISRQYQNSISGVTYFGD